jgi:hypothetical protein
VETRLIALVGLVLALGLGLAAFVKYERGVGAASVQQRWDAERAAVASAQSAEAARQAQEQAKVVREGQVKLDHVQQNLDSVRNAAAAYRLRYAAILARCGASAPAASASDPSASAPGVPTDMLGAASDRVVELAITYAKLSDKMRAGWETCYGSYNATVAP